MEAFSEALLMTVVTGGDDDDDDANDEYDGDCHRSDCHGDGEDNGDDEGENEKDEDDCDRADGRPFLRALTSSQRASFGTKALESNRETSKLPGVLHP